MNKDFILKKDIVKTLNEAKFKLKDKPFDRIVLESKNLTTISDFIVIKMKEIQQRELLIDFHRKNFNKFKADTEIKKINEDLMQCIRILAGFATYRKQL